MAGVILMISFVISVAKGEKIIITINNGMQIILKHHHPHLDDSLSKCSLTSEM